MIFIFLIGKNHGFSKIITDDPKFAWSNPMSSGLWGIIHDHVHRFFLVKHYIYIPPMQNLPNFPHQFFWDHQFSISPPMVFPCFPMVFPWFFPLDHPHPPRLVAWMAHRPATASLSSLRDALLESMGDPLSPALRGLSDGGWWRVASGNYPQSWKIIYKLSQLFPL